jgi:hypothetical protein
LVQAFTYQNLFKSNRPEIPFARYENPIVKQRSTSDGNLFTETYNQLNAYFATIPGNYALNLSRLYLLNTNYADLSFLFTASREKSRLSTWPWSC